MSVKRDFSGKVVIITGSSSGIGAVAAEEFAKSGAQVVITGRNAKNLSEVGKQCTKASPKRLKALEVVADVSNDEDCKRLIDATIKAFGRLDILVNNAGAGSNFSVVDPNAMEVFDQAINLNLRSVVQLTHLSVKHLEKTKGNIINISSMAALKPMLSMGAYCVAKCGLDMFSKVSALELGPKGIRVNIINPAGVRTGFMTAMGVDEKTSEDLMLEYEKAYPLGRHGTSQDVTSYIMFLASDECSWVTGNNFLADGGLLNAPMPHFDFSKK